MITRIEIDGFKSFKDFAMEFTPLTVIAGANASGKSNLFDALQLLSDIAEVELSEVFDMTRTYPLYINQLAKASRWRASANSLRSANSKKTSGMLSAN